MGTQHRHSRKLRFKIDDEWEHLDAPMFCDFLAAEFVGNRLGGQLTEESSSSSFFNNQVILEEGEKKQQSPNVPKAKDGAPNVACQQMLASPQPDENASPESVTSAQVPACSDARRSSAHSTAAQEQSRSSTKRASKKKASRRSKQGSMGPAGYPLTPVSDVPSQLTDSSGTRAGSSLTPGLHEVPPLALEKSPASAPTSAFIASGNHQGTAQVQATLDSLTSPHSTPSPSADTTLDTERVAPPQSRHSWKDPTPRPLDTKSQPNKLDKDPGTGGTDEVHNQWEAIPPVGNPEGPQITIATQEALRSHALSLGTSYVSSATGTHTHEGSSFISFAGFSDNTFPDSSATLEPLGAPSGGSTFSSLPGPSFFSVMGDSGQSLNPPHPPSPMAGAISQLSQLSQVSSSSVPTNLSPRSAAVNPTVMSNSSPDEPNPAHPPIPEGFSQSPPAHLAPINCSVTYMIPSPPVGTQATPQATVAASDLAVPGSHSESTMSGRSFASTAPSPSMLTVAEKIKRHEAAAMFGPTSKNQTAKTAVDKPLKSVPADSSAVPAKSDTSKDSGPAKFVRCAATSAPARQAKLTSNANTTSGNANTTSACGSAPTVTRTHSQPARPRKATLSPGPRPSRSPASKKKAAQAAPVPPSTAKPSATKNANATASDIALSQGGSAVPALNLSAMRSTSAAPATRQNSARNHTIPTENTSATARTIDYHADDYTASPRLPSPPSSSCPSPAAEISLVDTGRSPPPVAQQSPQQRSSKDRNMCPPAPSFDCAPPQPLADSGSLQTIPPAAPYAAGAQKSFGNNQKDRAHVATESSSHQLLDTTAPDVPNLPVQEDSCTTHTNAVRSRPNSNTNAAAATADCYNPFISMHGPESGRDHRPAADTHAAHASSKMPRHMFLREHHSESAAPRIRTSQSARSVAHPPPYGAGAGSAHSATGGRVTQEASEPASGGSRTPRQRLRDDVGQPRAKSAHTVGASSQSGSAMLSGRRKAQPGSAKLSERDSYASELSGRCAWEQEPETQCKKAPAKKLPKRELESIIDRLSKPKQGPRGLTTEQRELQEAERGRQRAWELSQKANQSWRRLQKSYTPPPIMAEETCPPGALMEERSALPTFGRGLKSQSSVFNVGVPGLRPENSMPDASMFASHSQRAQRPVSASQISYGASASSQMRVHMRPATARRERSRNGAAGTNLGGNTGNNASNASASGSSATPAFPAKPTARRSHDIERPKATRLHNINNSSSSNADNTAVHASTALHTQNPASAAVGATGAAEPPVATMHMKPTDAQPPLKPLRGSAAVPRLNLGAKPLQATDVSGSHIVQTALANIATSSRSQTQDGPQEALAQSGVPYPQQAPKSTSATADTMHAAPPVATIARPRSCGSRTNLHCSSNTVPQHNRPHNRPHTASALFRQTVAAGQASGAQAAQVNTDSGTMSRSPRPSKSPRGPAVQSTLLHHHSSKAGAPHAHATHATHHPLRSPRDLLTRPRNTAHHSHSHSPSPLHSPRGRPRPCDGNGVPLDPHAHPLHSPRGRPLHSPRDCNAIPRDANGIPLETHPLHSPRGRPMQSPRDNAIPIETHPAPGVRPLVSPREHRPYVGLSPRDATTARFLSPRDTPGTHRTAIQSPRNRDLPKVGPSPRPIARCAAKAPPASSAAVAAALNASITQSPGISRGHAPVATDEPQVGSTLRTRSATPRLCSPSSEATPRPRPQSPAAGSNQLSPSNSPRWSGVVTNRADWGSPVEGAGTAAIDGAIDAEISGRYLPSVLSQLSNETSASTVRTGATTPRMASRPSPLASVSCKRVNSEYSTLSFGSKRASDHSIASSKRGSDNSGLGSKQGSDSSSCLEAPKGLYSPNSAPHFPMKPGLLSAYPQGELSLGCTPEASCEDFSHNTHQKQQPQRPQAQASATDVTASSQMSTSARAGGKKLLSSEELALQEAKAKRAELAARRHANEKSWRKAHKATANTTNAPVATAAATTPQAPVATSASAASASSTRRCQSARNAPTNPPRAHPGSRPTSARQAQRPTSVSRKPTVATAAASSTTSNGAPSGHTATDGSANASMSSAAVERQTNSAGQHQNQQQQSSFRSPVRNPHHKGGVSTLGSSEQFSHPLATHTSRPPLPRLQLGLLVSSPTQVAYSSQNHSENLGSYDRSGRVSQSQVPATILSDDEHEDSDSDDACSVVSTGANMHAEHAHCEPVDQVHSVVDSVSGCSAASEAVPAAGHAALAVRAASQHAQHDAAARFGRPSRPAFNKAAQSATSVLASAKRLKRKGPEMYQPLPNVLRGASSAFKTLEATTCNMLNTSAALNRTIKRTFTLHAHTRAPTIPVGPTLATAARASGDHPPSHIEASASTSSVNPFRTESRAPGASQLSKLRAERSEPSVSAVSTGATTTSTGTSGFVFHAKATCTRMSRAPVAALRRGTTSASRSVNTTELHSVNSASEPGSHFTSRPLEASASVSHVGGASAQPQPSECFLQVSDAASCMGMHVRAPSVSPQPHGMHAASESAASSASPVQSTAGNDGHACGTTNKSGLSGAAACSSPDGSIDTTHSFAHSGSQNAAAAGAVTPSDVDKTMGGLSNQRPVSSINPIQNSSPDSEVCSPEPVQNWNQSAAEASSPALINDDTTTALTPTSPPMLLSAGLVSVTGGGAVHSAIGASAAHACTPSCTADIASYGGNCSGKENSPTTVHHCTLSLPSDASCEVSTGVSTSPLRNLEDTSTPRSPTLPQPAADTALNSHPCSVGTVLTATTANTAVPAHALSSSAAWAPTPTPTPRSNAKDDTTSHTATAAPNIAATSGSTEGKQANLNSNSNLQPNQAAIQAAASLSQDLAKALSGSASESATLPPSFALTNTDNSRDNNAGGGVTSTAAAGVASQPLTRQDGTLVCSSPVVSVSGDVTARSNTSLTATAARTATVTTDAAAASSTSCGAVASEASEFSLFADAQTLRHNGNTTGTDTARNDTASLSFPALPALDAEPLNCDSFASETPRIQALAAQNLALSEQYTSSVVDTTKVAVASVPPAPEFLSGAFLGGAFGSRVSLSAAPPSTGLAACLPFNSSPALVGFATPSALGLPATLQTAEERALCLQRSLAQDPFLPHQRRFSLSALANAQFTPGGSSSAAAAAPGGGSGGFRPSLDPVPAADSPLPPVVVTTTTTGVASSSGGGCATAAGAAPSTAAQNCTTLAFAAKQLSFSNFPSTSSRQSIGAARGVGRMSLTLSTVNSMARQQRMQRLSLGNPGGLSGDSARGLKAQKVSDVSATDNSDSSHRHSLAPLAPTLTPPSPTPGQSGMNPLKPPLDTPTTANDENANATINTQHASPRCPQDEKAGAMMQNDSKTAAAAAAPQSGLSPYSFCGSALTGENSTPIHDALQQFVPDSDLL